MAQTLIAKLRLASAKNCAILNAPAGFFDLLGPLPEGCALEQAGAANLDFVLLFTQDSAELNRLGPAAIRAIKPDGLLWIAYPKGSSGVKTDLTRDKGWELLAASGYRPIAQVAIDATWTGSRWRPMEHEQPADQIAAQYAAKKAALRPIYDRLLVNVQALGDDVQVQPRKTYVAFARGKQFAVVVPSTNTRVDLGLKLPGLPFSGRLADGANLGSGSISHRIALSSPAEVDEEVIAWLKQAYEAV